MGNTLTNKLHSEVICFEGNYLIHFVFSIIFILLTITLNFAFTWLLHNTRFYPNKATSKLNVHYELYLIVHKTVLVLLNNWVIDWIIYTYACIGTAFFVINFIQPRKFFNEIVQETFKGFIVVNTFATICFSFNVFNYFNAVTLLTVYVAGSLLLILTIYLKRNENWRVLLDEKVRSLDEVIRNTLIYIELVMNDTRKNSALIRGYSLLHSCNLNNCILKKYHTASKEFSAPKYRKDLLWHANEILLRGMQYYKESKELRLFRALILIDLLDDNGGALEELTIIEHSKPTFKEQCLIYQYRQAIKDKFISLESDNKEKQSIALAISYKSNSCSLMQKIQQATLLHTNFWDTLLNTIPDLAKLRDLAFQIQETVDQIEVHWSQMQEIYPDDPAFARLYACFASKILNDKDLSSKLREDFGQSIKDKLNIHEQRLSIINNEGFQNSGGEPFVTISGLQSNLGSITNYNSALCSIFGYNKKELIRKSISILLPEFLAEKYKQYLSMNMDKLNDDMLTKEYHIIGKTKNGYLISLYAELISKPSLLNDMNYIVLLHVDKFAAKSNTSDLLVDNNLIVRNISTNVIPILGLESYMLEVSSLKVTTLLPEVNLDDQIQRDIEINARVYIPNIKVFEDYHMGDNILCNSDGVIIKQGKVCQNARLYIEPLKFKGSEIFGYFMRLTLKEKSSKPIKCSTNYPSMKFCYDPEFNVYYMSNSKDQVKVYDNHKDPFTSKMLIIEESHSIHDFTLSDTVKKLSDLIEPYNSPFFDNILQRFKSIVNYLEVKGRGCDTAVLNNIGIKLTQQNCFSYASGIKAYCIVDGNIESKDKNKAQVMEIEILDNEVKGKKLLNRKKSTFLISNNIKGRKSLETTLIKEKNIILKWTAIISYLSILVILLLAIFNCIYLRKFFKSINKGLDLVNLSYQRLLVEQMLMYDICELYFVKE